MGSSVSGAINSYAGIEKYSPDFQLLGQVMNSKQTQLNSNRGKLQDYRNQLGALDVAKEEDRAYLDQRLDQVTDITNKYANLDLSSDALTNSLIGNMGQVFDQNVTAALTGTKILRNEQAEWTKMKEKDPSKYSDANYAYAMRQANQWLNDGATGTRYNGGGGFIEYASPTEHINKMMPELLKAATHKRQRSVAGPNNGVGGIITEEYVDRNELQSMIQSQLGEKHIRQMQIDAWNQYDQLPDEVLQQDYNNFTGSKIQENSDKIKSLEALIEDSSDPDVKQQYINSLEYAKKEKSSLENEGSYESMMTTRGKSGVYNTLHQNKLMDGFLDAYSREPLIVDIEVNAIDSANRELEMKREALAETKSQNKINNELKQEENDIAAFKAGLKDRNGNDIDPTKNLGTIAGKKLEIKPKYETNSTFSLLNEDHDKIETDIKSALLKMNVPEREAQWFLDGKRYASMIKKGDVAGLNTIVIGEGKNKKTYQVSEDFRAGILDMNVRHMNSPVLGKTFTDIDNMVSTAQTAIARGYKIGELSNKDIPDFTVRARYNEAGRVVFDVNPGGFDKDGKGQSGKERTRGYYAALLNKKANLKKGEDLSDIEKINLQLYGNLHLLNDGGITEEQASFVKQRLVSQLGDLKISNKDFSKIKLDRKVGNGSIIPNTRTTIEKWPETWMTEITKKDVSTTDESGRKNKIEKKLKEYQEDLDRMIANKQQSSLGVSRDFYEKSIKEMKKELQGSSEILDVKDHIEAGFKAIEKIIEDNTIAQTKLISGRETILPKNKYTKGMWERLAGAAGISTESTNDLVITPRIVNGVTTGEVYITNRGVKLDPKTAHKEKLQAGELEALKVLKIDLNQHNYNATKGEFAPALSLGTGIYKGKVNIGMEPSLKKKLKEGAEYYNNPAISTKVNEMLSTYSKGGYEVKYIPEGNVYVAKIFKAGSDEEVIPGFKGKGPNEDRTALVDSWPMIEDTEVARKLGNPKPEVDDFVSQLIFTQMQILENQD